MPSFLPRITSQKGSGEEVAGRPKTKRLRFGDHHGNNRVALPSVGSSPANGHHLSYFNSRQVIQKITDWYETWQPWQRKLLLCGITARCSTNQLELLATAMEPVFHRDFMTTLRGRYPSLSYSKHRRGREGSQHVRKRTGASGVALNDGVSGSPERHNVTTTVDDSNGEMIKPDGPSSKESIQVSKVGKVTVDISKDTTQVEVPTASKHTHDKPGEDHGDAEKPSISAEDASIIRKLSKQMQAHEINEARTDTPGSKISSHRSGTLSPIGESSPENEEEEEQALGAEEPLHTPVPSPNTALSLGVLTPIQETNSEVSSVSTIQEQPEFTEHSERETPQEAVAVAEDDRKVTEAQEAVQVTVTEAGRVADMDTEQKETVNEVAEQSMVQAVEDGKAVVQAMEGTEATSKASEGEKATVQAMEVEVLVEKQPALDQEMMLQYMLDARNTPQKEPQGKGEEAARNGHANGEVVRPKSDTTASRTRKSGVQSRSGSLESSHSAGSVRGEHKHRSNISSGSCRTVDFFSRQRTERLGSVRLQVSQGAPGWQDAEEVGSYAPLQQLYKYGRLWGASPEGRRLVPASSRLLQKNFMEQLNQIWQVLSEWEDHQKAEVLVEMIKGSTDGEVSFFAQCLLQRLKDQLDINCLPDHLLLRILGMLRAADLGRAAQVCRRWQYLVAQDGLWIRKCRELGSREDLPDIIGMVQMASLGDSVDWKQAYLELVFIANQARDMHAESDEDWEAELQELEYSLSRKERRSRQDRKSRRGTFSSSRMEEGKYSLASHIEDLQARLSSTILEDSQEVSGSRSAALTPSVLTTGHSRSGSRQTSRVHLEDRSTVLAPDEESLETEVVCKPLRRQLQGRRKSHDPGDAAMDIRHELKQPPEKLGKFMSVAGLPASDQSSTVSMTETHSSIVGAVHAVRKVRKLQGHMDSVQCLALDKRRLMTGSMDRTVRVWDIRSGRSIRKLYGHKGGIRSIHFNQTKICTGSWDMSIMVWDIVQFERLAVLTGHRGAVSCLQCNQHFLVSGSHDSTMMVWSLDSFEWLNVIEGHTQAVTCLQLIGRCVVSGSMDMTLRLSDIHTSECLQQYHGHQAPVLCLTVQKRLLLSGSADGQLHFWDLYTAEPLAIIQPHDGPVNSVALAGRRFLTGSNDAVLKEWDLVTLTCLRSLHGHKGPIRQVKTLLHHVVSCSDDGFIRLWDLTKTLEDTT
ncbi:F-box/WD repeat-containing protein 7-like [Branchiostoma floridae]|uniref:F-box/WD repeat-containing protein 7-like n=1 Tax=Branchiostoma floridae TaxID=7739 RepID=A0A9J7N8Z4_BRAFL|nr:F-box/WD repeat-containing protein 7-like [Branchiostoma floridae]